MKTAIAALFLGLSTVGTSVAAETYKETFECEFGRGLANRPTPSRVVFSVDEYGRSALLHNVEIPKLDTDTGSGRIKRDTHKLLAIAWVGDNYLYSASGRPYATNESRYDAIDLRDLEFTINLNRNTMKATVKSATSIAYNRRDGFAKGSCIAIAAPK
ncbi:hypothetical protein [Roseibium sp. RKSG952]|uniref:hypothetical protein n=1 Tax=Roseibium sp. RKSG952 TaxID=2529384 RepID=UPI0012BD4480|nr:hypothetical protein [Roseibium sp. RKSG952]MTI03679.1 hypothetical protein [Roseibium sp. RKSG952]